MKSKQPTSHLLCLDDFPAGWYKLLTMPVLPQRKIVAFHQDAHGDWVADLECGHTQHVRHKPPFQNRPWVITTEGRSAYLGRELPCKRCAEEIAFAAGAG